MENRVWMAEMNPTMRTKPTPDYSEREQALSGRHASAIRSKSNFTIARVLWQTRKKTLKTLVMGLLPGLLVQDRYSLAASSNLLQQRPFAAHRVAPSWQTPCRVSGRTCVGVGLLPLLIETAWVILNSARALAGYPTLSMIADLSTAPKPSQ
jgi:hypothetical protein